MTALAGRLIVPALLMALSLGTGNAAGSKNDALRAAARKDGEVTWYVASMGARAAEAAGLAFTAKYGVKTNVVQGPSQVVFQRLTQELAKGAHNADVFSSVDVGKFMTLKEQDALTPYVPANAAKLLPVFQGLDKDGAFHATIASVVAIAYNTDRVTADEAPQTWTDLLHARWSGQIALGHPAFSGFAGNWAVQMHNLYGRSYFDQLKQQKPEVSRSVLNAVKLVATGERAIAVVPVAPVLKYADRGKPLAVRYPSDGSILVSTPSAIVEGAPHPNAAKLFMEFLLGPEFGNILAAARYEAMRADVKPLPGATPVTEINIVRPTIAETTKGLPQVAKLWREIFGQ